MSNNFITLDTAVQMTARYRRQMDTILAAPFKGQNLLVISETFDRAAFDALLDEADCTAVRIYYGMSDDLKIHAIVVGVNSKNEDILPVTEAVSALSSPPVIVEEGTRCPDNCPPKSPLNP